VGGACSTYGERIGIYRVLVGKPEGKRPLGGPRLRWEDNIKIGGMDWLDMAQDSCECGNGPSVSIKWGEFRDWLRTC